MPEPSNQTTPLIPLRIEDTNAADGLIGYLQAHPNHEKQMAEMYSVFGKHVVRAAADGNWVCAVLTHMLTDISAYLENDQIDELPDTFFFEFFSNSVSKLPAVPHEVDDSAHVQYPTSRVALRDQDAPF